MTAGSTRAAPTRTSTGTSSLLRSVRRRPTTTGGPRCSPVRPGCVATWNPVACRSSRQARDLEVFKDVGLPVDICKDYGVPARHGYLGDRPHPDGDRVGSHHRRLASVLHARRPVRRAQRLVLELLHRPARPRGRRGALRDGERHRGGGPADRPRDGAAGAISATRSDVLQKEMDGFYTLVCATADQLAVVRDAVRVQAGDGRGARSVRGRWRPSSGRWPILPDIEHAEVFEPTPTELYLWERPR